MSGATRSPPPCSGDFVASRFATAYSSGEVTRLDCSWPPYLVAVPLSTGLGTRLVACSLAPKIYVKSAVEFQPTILMQHYSL